MTSPKYNIRPVALVGMLLITFFYMSEHFNWRKYLMDKIKNLSASTIVFHNLCTEHGETGTKLVVYSSAKNGSNVITVKAGPHYPQGTTKWLIFYSTLPVPKTLNYTFTKTAFFVSTTCEGNFHHFWHDCVNGLFGAMKVLGALGSSDVSQLFYASDVWTMDKRTGCHDPSRYEEILFKLPVKKEHIYYANAKPHSCFQTAWFGYYNKKFTLEEKRDHFKEAFNITCASSRRTKVTIINRKLRSVLNADDLRQAAENAGFDVSVVYLSSLSIRQQFNVIMCTDILVGVQGAGLRWIDFLPSKSSLLELIWKNWGTFYASQATNQGKRSTTLTAKNVILNLPIYFKVVHNNTSIIITKALLQEYYQKGYASEYDNHWKWADAVFDSAEFVKKLKYLKPSR